MSLEQSTKQLNVRVGRIKLITVNLCIYPLVNVYITMERSTMFGKIHYFYIFRLGHFQ